MPGSGRYVTREVTPAPLLKETPIPRGWDWVAKSLWSGSSKCRINLLDTVLAEGDGLSLWLFTNKQGYVKKKSEKNLNRDKVKSHFYQLSAAYARNSNEYAAVMHMKDTSKVLTREELNTAMTSALDNMLALQAYALPRGATPGFSNFRHEYSIYGGSNDVAPVNNTFKYCQSLPGSDRQLVRSKDARVNAALKEMTVNVVKFVEATRRCHVTKLSAEFCVDDENVPWFMRTTVCLTVNKAKTTRKVVDSESTVTTPLASAAFPKNFPANRRPVSPIKDATGTAFAPPPEPVYPRNLNSRKSPKKGRWSQERRLQRKRKEAKRLEESTHHRSRSRRASLTPRSIASTNTEESLPLGATGKIPADVLAGVVDVEDADAPPPMYQSGTVAETLGSTQSKGCSGDFCSVALAPKVTSKPGRGAKKAPVWTAASARAGLSSTGIEEDDTAVSRVQPAGNRVYKVPFRMVAQARQEAYYVQLMLKRHRQGQQGEFISSGYYPEATAKIAERFPASFYRQVEVCEQCFRVYQKVEKERNKSLAKRAATARRMESSSKRRSRRPRTGRSTYAGSVAAPKRSADGEGDKGGALARAQEALNSLSLGDIAEMRSYMSPPPAVSLVVTALMLLLTGERLEWSECRRIMSGGDALIEMIMELDVDGISARRLNKLIPIIRNPVFHPDSVRNANRAASYLSAWVLGVCEYTARRLNMHMGDDEDGERATSAPSAAAGFSSTPSLPPLSGSRGSMGRATSASTTSLGGTLTFAQKLEQKRRRNQRKQMQRSRSEADADFAASFKKAGKPGKGKRHRGGDVDAAEAWGLEPSPSAAGLSGTGRARDMDETGRKRSSPSRRGKGSRGKGKRAAANAAARRAQQYHTKRLHEAKVVDPTGPQSFVDAPTRASEPDIESKPKLFRCPDGHTTIPYQVIGAPDRLATTVNFVVVHDFFDTFESVQVLLRDFMKTSRSQFLLMNLPGQAFTDFDKNDKNLVLNNEYQAARLNELLLNADKTMEFNTSSQGFHVVGIGNGGNIAACWGVNYGASFSPMLKSLALVNGFATVDKQLASVLHSSANVFSCFPDSRPDLPVSYFTRFLFSEDYVKRVTMDLALSMYTAVTNPITLAGRVKITRGALQHSDLRLRLPGLRVPLVIMQCTDDVLISPSNVDDLLEGRLVRHVWSHEQDTGASASWFGPRSVKRLREVLRKPDGALVLWIKCGHEVRMEAKNQFLLLLSSLADPDAAQAQAEGGGAAASGDVMAPTRMPAPPQFGVPDFHQQPKQGAGDRPATGGTAAGGKVPMKYSRRRRAAAGSKRRGGKRGKRGDDHRDEDDEEDDAGRSPSPARGGGYEEAGPDDEAARAQRLADTEANYQAAMEEHRRTQAARKRAQQQESKLREAEGKGEEEEAEVKLAASSPPRQRSSARSVQPSPLRSPAPAPAAAAAVPEPQQQPSPRSRAREALAVGSMGAAHVPAVQGSSSSAGGDAGESERVRARREKEEQDMAMRLEMLQAEQEARRRQWQREDEERQRNLAAAMARDREDRAVNSETAALQAEIDAQTRDLLANTRSAAASGQLNPMQEPEREAKEQEGKGADADADADADDGDVDADGLAAVEGEQPDQQYTDLTAMFQEMEEQDRHAKDEHAMELEQYQKVKDAMAEAKQALLDQQRDAASKEEREAQDKAIIHLQRVGRGYNGRQRFKKYKENREEMIYKDMVVTRVNAVVRGFLDRCRVRSMRKMELLEKQKGGAARVIQRVARGAAGRRRVRGIREDRAGRQLQRVYRGHLGRRFASIKRQQRDRAEVERVAATTIQATWRMKAQFEIFRELQILQLAAIQIQRVWRGWLGRRRALRKRDWEKAPPGPERLKLGLKLIEGSKEAFERQRQEIDALHRAQERAEARVSEIYAGLKESEEELQTLERELKGVDQLDDDLRELTHDKRLIDEEVAKDEEEAHSVAASRHTGTGHGSRGRRRSGARRSSVAEAAAQQRAADAYALEVAIHMKKAEREKKKMELEAEFAGVFAEIEKKKSELGRLEDNISGMEALRQRKDREFQRLQRNLTELLAEQKAELDALREKGVQLETATATSAAAAAATAAAAKEAEKRSQAMFQSTEELLKFQFMSMSLSYFSSLNMLSSLREVNADTTNKAVASSADTAAAAAAAAAAANIPSLKQMNMGAGEILDAASRRRKMEEAEKVKRVEEAKKALAKPFDDDVNKWNIHDVGRWLDTLTLGQYKRAFEEAAVDGEFLMELRGEDLSDVLGVEHRLHVKKILAARDKLRPLTKEEQERKQQVEWERKAAEHRGESGITDKLGQTHDNDANSGPPPLPTVFSMVRHNRIKRLKEAIDKGFDLEATDDTGNTLLLVACQNVNRRAVEMCIERGANINAQNQAGNSALHFAMAYDPDGALGEYLIDKGANDMLENKLGLSPYDGLSLDG